MFTHSKDRTDFYGETSHRVYLGNSAFLGFQVNLSLSEVSITSYMMKHLYFSASACPSSPSPSKRPSKVT